MFALHLFALFVFLAVSAVLSLPGGAPCCTIGTAAVDSLHLNPSRNPVTGPLSAAGFQVTVNGTLLTTDTVYSFPVGQSLAVQVSSVGAEQFKGALIILSKSGVDLTAGLLASGPFQVQPDCPPAGRGGFTHTSPVLKDSADATLFVEKAYADIALDVNLVFQNNVNGSIYYYSGFKLESVSESSGDKSCGLFGLSLFCPLSFCGFFGSLLGLCNN